MTAVPEVTDPARSGYSLANLGELLFGCLEAIGAKSVVEIGAYRGDLTRALLGWATGSGARVTAVELEPPPELERLSEQRPELGLIRQASEDALPDLPLPDALIIDGDHNYYTVSRELRVVGERASGVELPLLIFHDVGWPHGRRDVYYAPDRVPEAHRQPLAHDAALAPGEAGVADAGLRYEWVARREGGPGNGVLTAIEDFARSHEGVRIAIVPAFFGVGVVWHRDAPWAGAVAEIVEPWDRNPLLERLEANRVALLIEGMRLGVEYGEIIRQVRERRASQERVLRAMLGSRAFAWGEWLSRLRQGGRPAFSREQVRRALGE
jgi:Methyltransferase domain